MKYQIWKRVGKSYNGLHKHQLIMTCDTEKEWEENLKKYKNIEIGTSYFYKYAIGDEKCKN